MLRYVFNSCCVILRKYYEILNDEHSVLNIACNLGEFFIKPDSQSDTNNKFECKAPGILK